MQRLSNFYRLPAIERWLLVKAALLLVATRVALGLLPFRTLRDLSAKVAAPHRLRETDSLSTEAVVWAVEVAAKYMPGFFGTCLTKALTTQVLLSRRGHSALLRIGVVRSEEGGFEAHAWVESEGKVVTGGTGLENFIPLAVFKGEVP